MTTTLPAPGTPEELLEVLNDKDRMAGIWSDKDQLRAFVQGYADNFAGRDKGETAAQAREQMQLVLAEYLAANGRDVKNVRVEPGMDGHPDLTGLSRNIGNAAWQARRQGLYNKAAAGAQVEHLFDRPADFFRALAMRCGSVNQPDHGGLMAKLDENARILNTFGTNIPSDGGFLLPEGYRSDLLMVGLEDELIRPLATVIPMDTERVTIPAVDSTTNSSSVFGGIIVYWVDESTQATESSAKFQAVTLDAKKLMAYCKAPNELVNSPTAFGAFLDQALPMAMAFERDYRFMQGTGVGEPLGFVNCPASIASAGASHLGANTIGPEDLMGMYARMLPSSLMKAIWIADIGTFPQLAAMAIQGSLANSAPVWMNSGSIAGSPPISIYGRPVHFTEKVPALGTTGDICFLDPAFYLIGDRQAVTASASPHFAFNIDMTAFKIIERMDGRPWLNSAITPKNGGNTISPFVQLSGTRT